MEYTNVKKFSYKGTHGTTRVARRNGEPVMIKNLAMPVYAAVRIISDVTIVSGNESALLQIGTIRINGATYTVSRSIVTVFDGFQLTYSCISWHTV